MDRITVWAIAIIFSLVIGGLSYLFFQTSAPEKTNTQMHRPTHYNFCVLLDLSDRIDKVKAPNQADRDKEIIKTIFSVFVDQVKKKLYINSKDILQIAVAPQPTNYDSTLFKIGKDLKLDMGKLKITEKKNKLPELEKSFNSSVDLLYERAVKNSKFWGADIWAFFKNDIGTYFLSSTKDTIKNILIILTDGYIEFDKSVLSKRPRQGNRTSYMEMAKFRNHANWEKGFDSNDYGLIPIKKGNDPINIQVLVLEISPKSPLDPTEFDIIRKYWLKWFNEMGIRTTDRTINKAQASHQIIKDLIEKFIAAN